MRSRASASGSCSSAASASPSPRRSPHSSRRSRCARCAGSPPQPRTSPRPATSPSASPSPARTSSDGSPRASTPCSRRSRSRSGAQRRLVADASHELRTPLTAARTNIDLLLEGRLPEDEQRHALAEAGIELDALTTLVSDLVELARGEERKLRVEDVQLDDLVATVVDRAKARAPGITFVTSFAPTHVEADPVLLERAVSNLVDNAIKWSPVGGPVEVTVREGEVIVARPRAGDRRERPAADLRPLLPGRRRPLEAGRRARARDRARGRAGARRRCDRRELAAAARAPAPPDPARRGPEPQARTPRRRRARRPRSASCRP